MDKIRKMLVLMMCALLLVSGVSACAKEAESVPEPTPTPTEAPTLTETPTPTPTETPTPTPTPEPIAATETTPVPEEPIPEGMVKSFVTGEYIEEEIGTRRPVAVMIDNINGACPQSGIGNASLYFESPVEGRYTRMCAVFEKYDDLQRIGPIRSCRDYFIALAAGLDDIYTHYGQAAYAFPYLESDYVDNLSGLAYYAGPYFYRDNTYHVAPHNAYTSGEQLNAAIEAREYRKNHEEDYEGQYKFCWVGNEVDMSAGRTAEYVSPGYPINQPYFVYQPDTKTYKRYQYGTEHIDVETGEQLEVKNIIFEFQCYAHYQDSQYLHFETTMGGKGVYITDGKCVDITWERENFYGPVKYFDTEGNELEINTGKSWVGLIQNEFLSECKIGTSAEDLSCVVSEEEAQAAAVLNEEWLAAYKHQEEPYLSEMAKQRDYWVAQHGGQSKVEG